jgi:hypothetical protein
VPREPDPAQHVVLKEPQPIFIAYLDEWLRLENAHVIDEQIDVRISGDHLFATLRRADIRRDALDLGAGDLPSQLIDRGLDARLLASVDRDARALAGKRLCRGESDSGRRAADEGTLSDES